MQKDHGYCDHDSSGERESKKPFFCGKRACFYLTLCTLMLLGLSLFQGPAHATTWIVTSGADDGARETLRHAVENAAAGDTVSIRVPVVNLRGYLFVNRNLTISGYPSATLRQTVTGERVVYFIPGITCTLKGLTITGGDLSGSSACGAGLINHGTLTMENCTVTNNTVGGGILNAGNLTMYSCTVSYNTANWPRRAAGINNEASGYSTPVLTMYNCVVEGNENYDTAGGGILNGEILYMYCCVVDNNKSKGSGGGLLLNLYTETYLAQGTKIKNNTPDQIAGSGTYTTDGNCYIGGNPGRSSVALAGVASGASPEARSTAGDSDVRHAEEDLGNSGSLLYGEVKDALSGDLHGISGNLSVSLEGMNATLYNAFTYENVPLEDVSGNGDLEIEFTASWPRYVRYYAAFALAGEDAAHGGNTKTLVPGSYVLPERGIQFEIEPGQDLPDGVTPPEFYETGEGLRTWRNVVTDNGSFDLNPEAGVVTFRVCSVRAEAEAPAPASGGSSGGCSTGTTGVSGLSLLLLLGLPGTLFFNK